MQKSGIVFRVQPLSWCPGTCSDARQSLRSAVHSVLVLEVFHEEPQAGG